MEMVVVAVVVGVASIVSGGLLLVAFLAPVKRSARVWSVEGVCVLRLVLAFILAV